MKGDIGNITQRCSFAWTAAGRQTASVVLGCLPPCARLGGAREALVLAPALDVAQKVFIGRWDEDVVFRLHSVAINPPRGHKYTQTLTLLNCEQPPSLPRDSGDFADPMLWIT
jgi:hypothetical protein